MALVSFIFLGRSNVTKRKQVLNSHHVGWLALESECVSLGCGAQPPLLLIYYDILWYTSFPLRFQFWPTAIFSDFLPSTIIRQQPKLTARWFRPICSGRWEGPCQGWRQRRHGAICWGWPGGAAKADLLPWFRTWFPHVSAMKRLQYHFYPFFFIFWVA